jgi:hypothetical protein
MSAVPSIRLVHRPRPRPITLDPKPATDRTLFVFRGPRGSNLLSAAIYASRRGHVLWFSVGAREMALPLNAGPIRSRFPQGLLGPKDAKDLARSDAGGPAESRRPDRW